MAKKSYYDQPHLCPVISQNVVIDVECSEHKRNGGYEVDRRVVIKFKCDQPSESVCGKDKCVVEKKYEL